MLFILLITSLAIGQERIDFITIKSGRRIKTLQNNKGDYLEFVIPANNDAYRSNYRSVQGIITRLTNDSLTINLTSDKLFEVSSDCSHKESTTTYTIPTGYCIFGLNQVSQINYQSKQSANWVQIGASSLFIGSLISLIVAPLISINYNTGQVNSARYITCASIGLTFVAIGIPIMVCSKEKTYYLKRDQAPGKSRIWTIK